MSNAKNVFIFKQPSNYTRSKGKIRRRRGWEEEEEEEEEGMGGRGWL